MSTDTFSEPTPEFEGVRINPRDVVGHLLMVWAVEYIAHRPTQFTRPDKPSDVIVVDCVDLDVTDPDTGGPGYLARKVWWRQAKLIQTLKLLVGNPQPVLARMGKGGASQGFNAPFILNTATSDQSAVERARKWLAANPSFKPSNPGEFPDMTDATWVPSGDQVPAPEPTRQETMLERLARQAREGAARLPPPPPSAQSDIPF